MCRKHGPGWRGIALSYIGGQFEVLRGLGLAGIAITAVATWAIYENQLKPVLFDYKNRQ